MVSPHLVQAELAYEMSRVRPLRRMHHPLAALQPSFELNGADVASLFALRTSTALERNTLIFGQAFKAICLNIFKVGEQVTTAIVRGNEAKTFGIIEPFYCTSLNTHVTSL